MKELKQTKIIPREKLLKKKGFEFKDMLKKEAHHADEIVLGEDGKYYWKANPITVAVCRKVGMGNVWKMLDVMGYGRNSEEVRQWVRQLGYSLFGYWELFYCEMNNPDAKYYKPVKK